MDDRRISRDQIEGFARMLRREELRESTIENYLRHVAALGAWMGDEPVTKERVAAWKESLLEGGRCPGTVNSMLVSANRFLAFLGWGDCQVKALRVQRQLFRENQRELTRGEFDRLIAAARAAGRERLLLLMETICSTGIRVSEVKYITVEALRCGKAEIALKGKIRTILLPARLCRKLLKYCKKKKHRLRRGVPHKKRFQPVPQADLGGDEVPVRAGGGGALQGVPPQPAAPVRPGLFQGLSGRGPAGGRAGPQLYGDHPHLPDLHRDRARPHPGAAAAGVVEDKITILSQHKPITYPTFYHRAWERTR